MLLGLAGAITAAVAYGSATILQALGIASLPDVHRRDLPWRERIRAGRLYAVGLAADLLGFVASLLALRHLPLFLVQAALASSVAVTAALAAVTLGTRLHGSELGALGVTSIGFVLLAVSAQEGPGRRIGQAAGWLMLAGAALLVAVLVPAARSSRRSRAALVLATVSGVAFGVVAVAARTLLIRHPLWHTVSDPILYALVVAGALGAIAYGMALDRGKVTTVATVTFMTETVLPAAVGLAVLGDAVRPHFLALAVIGFVATVGGSIALAGFVEPAGGPGPRPDAAPLSATRRPVS